jgi:preprotein translocase subunit SecA
VRQRYDEQEAEFPVRTGLSRYLERDAQGHKHVDRDQLAAWASARFDVPISVDELKNKQRDEIAATLLAYSRAYQEKAKAALAEVQDRVDRLFGGQRGRTAAAASGGNGALDSLSSWLKDRLDVQLPSDEIGKLERDELAQRLEMAVELHYRPEMRRLERVLVLDILDETWKNHLLAMDHLRSSVGLRGYAQVDPKVEYKREGMRHYEVMWQSVAAQVTGMIFKMEDLNEDFVRSTFVERAAIHESPGQSAMQEERPPGEVDPTASLDVKLEPIRHHGPRVGRNDPCPCGSNKKYKNCHGRPQGR